MKGFHVVVALLTVLFGRSRAYIEEFQAHDPQEFHKAAMDKFLEMRRKDPSVSLNQEGEFMTMANRRAVERLRRKPDEALSLKVSKISLYC